MSFGYGRDVPERDAIQSLHRYTTLTLYATIPVGGLAPLLVAVANGARWERLIPLVAGLAVLLPVHWRRLSRAIEAPAEVRPWRPSAVLLVFTVGLMLYGYLYADQGNAIWSFLPALALTELLYGRSPTTAWRLTSWVGVTLGVLVAVLTEYLPDGPNPLLAAAVTVFVVFTMPFAELVALRQWRLTLELDQARRDAAELGATRERLRFAEDLHDILGHALEVVSLKSELATRLGEVDPARANAEMAEVQRLARGALRDVRQLARGRRPTDLETELTGARTLLTSAGIDCEITRTDATRSPHSELLGRVLREAVTNLLRHANTRRCWITVSETAVTVVNDGVDPARTPGDGTGLTSLNRRMREAGGELRAGPGAAEGTFTVAATL